MTQASETDRIVGALTPAQREAMIGARDLMSNHGGFPLLTVEYTGEPWPKGVAQFLTLKSDRLTPLGLVVRAALTNQEQDSGE